MDNEATDRVEVLGSQRIALDGPFKISLDVMLIGTADEFVGYDAWANVSLPPGVVPDEAKIVEMVQAALDQTKGFRLATRKEFVSSLLAERTGVNTDFSIPGPKQFRLAVCNQEAK